MKNSFLHTAFKISSFIIAVSLFSNCVKLPVVTSLHDKDVTDTSRYSGFDNKSKIGWRVSNDDKYLYFWFETADKSKQMQIMRGGFVIYLDTTGKRTEGCSLAISNEGNQQRIFSRDKPSEINPHGKRPMMSSSFSQAIWTIDNNSNLINLLVEKTNFSATFKIDTFGVMSCKSAIPFSAINYDNIASLKNLSIGFKLQTMSQPRPNREDGERIHSGGEGGKRTGRNGGNREGGIYGNHGGMRAGKGLSQPEEVAFWFALKLIK